MTDIKNIFNGKPITAVFLGGSITEGAASSAPETCYASLAGDFLKEQFGAVRVINSGIGGTNSRYGLLRLQRDVLDYAPDIVFLEFAVNDGKRDSRADMEGIVRTLQMQEKVPYVVFIYTTDDIYSTCTSFHHEVAAYYNIPEISFKDALKAALDGKNPVAEGYFNDSVHPKDAGHAVYAAEFRRCMSDIAYYRRPAVREKPLTEAPFGCVTAFADPDTLTHSAGWQAGIGHRGYRFLLAEQGGETLEFTFDGNFFAVEHGLHRDSGIYRVFVDGTEVGSATPYYNMVSNQHVLGYCNLSLAEGQHTVRLETAVQPQNGGKGNRVLLYHILTGRRFSV